MFANAPTHLLGYEPLVVPFQLVDCNRAFVRHPNFVMGRQNLPSTEQQSSSLSIRDNLKNYIKLEIFECSNCNLSQLPDLPKSLKYLNCSFNKLVKLPDLPNSLSELHCFENNLIELPNLPNSLTSLACYGNKLIKLPNLPNLLEFLCCEKNNLTELSIKFCSPTIKEIKYITADFDFNAVDGRKLEEEE